MTYKKALALVEFNSIAHGIGFADEMLKGGDVELLDNYPTCPGKHIVIVSGDTHAVKESYKRGLTAGEDFLLEHSIIPNVHPQVLKAAMGVPTTTVEDMDALGVVESFSVIKTVEAADYAVKEAPVKLVDMRLGKALGGKGYFILTGEIGSIKSSVMKSIDFLKETVNLVQYKIIPAPSDEMKKSLL